MNKYITLLISIFLLTSCSKIKEPSLERIEGVEILEMTSNRVNLNAFMILNNPNIFALDLANADFKALVDDIEVATIQQNFDTSMPASGEFKMPVVIDMNLKKLYEDNPILAISKGLKIIGERKINIQFLGNIKVGKGAAKITVPIDQIELVEF